MWTVIEPRRAQAGAALMMALVFVTIFSLMGTVAMRRATTGTEIAGAAALRADAFAIADGVATSAIEQVGLGGHDEQVLGIEDARIDPRWQIRATTLGEGRRPVLGTGARTMAVELHRLQVDVVFENGRARESIVTGVARRAPLAP